jgi:hypothetical protein
LKKRFFRKRGYPFEKVEKFPGDLTKPIAPRHLAKSRKGNGGSNLRRGVKGRGYVGVLRRKKLAR